MFSPLFVLSPFLFCVEIGWDGGSTTIKKWMKVVPLEYAL